MKIKAALYGITALLSGVSCSENAPAESDATGVWADADCELLRTEGFALLFERSADGVTATLHRMDKGDTILLGRTVFGKDSVLERYVWSRGDAQQPADLGELQPDGQLRIAVDGRTHLLKKIEAVAVVEPYEMLHPSPLEVGSCIQQWNLGTKFGDGKGAVSFEAGTNRHNYTFNIQPGMVYCRAARLRFNDRGGLFAQNIRLMANPREYSCHMADDNLAESAAPLVIDDAKFAPGKCVFDADGIYWSFIRFDGDTAEINGCGETYRYPRPKASEKTLDEWIAFEKY